MEYLIVVRDYDMARILNGGWLSNYLLFTDDQESPKNFHLWSGLAILGAAMKRHIWIDRKFYKIYPNLYTIMVAASAACKKSTATDIGISILESLKNVRIYHERLTTEGLIDFMAEGQPEQLGSKIQTDSSIIIYASELAVFLSRATFAQDIIPILTSLYLGKKIWEYKTIKRGHIKVVNVSPSFLGATTPESLAKCMPLDVFGLGFAGRIVFVVEKEVGKKIAWMSKNEDLEKLLIQELDHISKLYGEMQVSDQTKRFYKDWYDSYTPKESHPALLGFYQRKPDLVLKIALILSINYNDALTLSEHHITAAISMIEAIEDNMYLAFQYTGTESAALSQEVLDFLSKRKTPMSQREIVTRFRNKIKNLDELSSVMKILQDMGMTRSITRGTISGYELIKTVKKVRSPLSTTDILEYMNGKNYIQPEKTEEEIPDWEITENQQESEDGKTIDKSRLGRI